MIEKIHIQHPQGKKGVTVDKVKYELIKRAILESLQEFQTLSFSDLKSDVSNRLSGAFNGSKSWYFTWVNIDLEGKNIVKVDRSKNPNVVTLV